MMRVQVDRELCRIHAQCVFAAPEVFELDENDELHYVIDPDGSLLPAVEEAALLCPVQAISFHD
ncbi:ferredoxin [Microtetraspora niveoalba]|uniref:ferredoxin n=1 Tax=Microtetraspora niveoalba TaxID=46175 RepID=UPI000B1B5AD0|nr:ferredoxin [Microtetraspora niveoalba]